MDIKMQEFDRFSKGYFESLTSDEKVKIRYEHRSRAKEGKQIWNSWARKFSEHIQSGAIENPLIYLDYINVSQQISFAGFQFPCDVSFEGSSFEGEAEFVEAEFHGAAIFDKTLFEGVANFENAKFNSTDGLAHSDNLLGQLGISLISFKNVKFKGVAHFEFLKFDGPAFFTGAQFDSRAIFTLASFELGANFSGCVFNDQLSFEDAVFKTVPDFNFASFVQPPHIANIKIPKLLDHPNVVECYRKIKQMAIDSSDHENELRFFGYETHAKAYLKETPIFQKGIIKLYYLFSNFGYSIRRPLASLVIFFTIALVANFWGINPDTTPCKTNNIIFAQAVASYTLSNALPIIKMEKLQAQAARECLFGETPLTIKHNVWSAAHLMPTALFLFLFGLGVRNRFKIK